MVYIYDIKDKFNCVATFVDNFEESYYTCDWGMDPNGNLLFGAGGLQKSFKIYDVGKQEFYSVLIGHGAYLTEGRFIQRKDGVIAVTASSDGGMRIWNAKLGNCIVMYYGHTSEILTFDIHMNKCTLVSGSTDRFIMFWDLSKKPIDATIHQSLSQPQTNQPTTNTIIPSYKALLHDNYVDSVLFVVCWLLLLLKMVCMFICLCRVIWCFLEGLAYPLNQRK